MVADADACSADRPAWIMALAEIGAPAASEDHASRALLRRRSDGRAAGFRRTVGGRESVAASPLRSMLFELIDVGPTLFGGSAQRSSPKLRRGPTCLRRH